MPAVIIARAKPRLGELHFDKNPLAGLQLDREVESAFPQRHWRCAQNPRRQALACVPAAESRGAGIFLQLPESAVDQWGDRVAANDRVDTLRQAHHDWRERRGLDASEWPGERYLLLHTLSHALINEFALECGYSAAAIRERIYAAEASGSDPAMAGLLLYTAAPDSEGTLGGLVALGEPETLGRLLSGGGPLHLHAAAKVSGATATRSPGGGPGDSPISGSGPNWALVQLGGAGGWRSRMP